MLVDERHDVAADRVVVQFARVHRHASRQPCGGVDIPGFGEGGDDVGDLVVEQPGQDEVAKGVYEGELLLIEVLPRVGLYLDEPCFELRTAEAAPRLSR